MWLSSHPQAIVADAHSSATITAEVRDPSGRAVPDGTPVDFTTNLGIIERRARTIAGVARVRLESGTTTGTALISAVAADGNAVAQLRVDFLEPGTEMFDESFISVESPKYLGYDVDSQIVDSAGGVTIYHRGLTITAEEAQIDLKTNILRAKARTGGDPIKIKQGEKLLRAAALYYYLETMKGILIELPDEGARRIRFRGRDFFAEPWNDEATSEPQTDLVNFDFQPISKSKLFVRCRSLIIRPGIEIKFKRASYYVDGDKMLSVPLQVISLRGESGGTGQMLAYGTEGVRLDLPLYYLLTPTSTGALRLRHSESTGWGYYSDREGWQVDIDQDYNIGGFAEGRFSINRINSSDWGIRWNQRTEFANDSRLYTYLDFPARRDLYGTIDYSRSMRNYTWAVNFRGDKMRNVDGRCWISTYLQSRAKPLIGDAVIYAITTRLSYNTNLTGDRDKLGRGIGLQFYGKPILFGHQTTLNTSLNIARDWGGANPGATVFANIGLFRMLGTVGMTSLTYSYSWADSIYGYNAQRLSANLSLSPTSGWGASIYATYGMNDHTLSAFGDLGYTFPGDWRLSFLSTLQRFQYVDFSDFEIALSKLLGRQEARLTWSQSRKRVRFEFTTARF
ncbi:MAG: Ig-like domain-containing protein [Armatimonadetes bacterium]|nr:Ig-like domain-containing protein [Armatimonadota bacterium]